MANKLQVVTSPHIRDDRVSTSRIMQDVLLALRPAAVAGVCIFGARTLLVIAVSVFSCELFEYLACRILKRPNPLRDCSAAVTGLLLALNLPVGLPLPMVIVGCFVAIVVVKQLFGGLGQNFANPAITARIVLLTSFAGPMTTWARPAGFHTVDAVTCATPLALLAQGGELPDTLTLFLGNHGGCIGETCAPALLLGGLYLVLRHVIRPTVPLIYVGGVALGSWLLGFDPLYQVLSGGLLLGAIFMATDYTTSPITERGRVIFAVGLALLTLAIRCFGSYPEGVSYSILLMNLVTPLIDRWCQPSPFGARAAAPARKGGSAA